MSIIPTHPHWIQTFSGQALDLQAPTADMIHLVDIAVCLSRVPRFGGHTRTPYSVAQHSLVVMTAVKDMGCGPLLQLQALMHDAPEAYIGDVPSPLKRMLSDYKGIEDRIWQAVCDKFNLPATMAPEVKDADMLALIAEAHAHLSHGPIGGWAPERPELSAEATHHLTTPYFMDREQGSLASLFTVRVHALQRELALVSA